MLQQGTVKTTGLNVHELAGVRSKVRDKLKKGDRVNVLDGRNIGANEWLYVRHLRGVGWVYGSDITLEPVPIPPLRPPHPYIRPFPDVPEFRPLPRIPHRPPFWPWLVIPVVLLLMLLGKCTIGSWS